MYLSSGTSADSAADRFSPVPARLFGRAYRGGPTKEPEPEEPAHGPDEPSQIIDEMLFDDNTVLPDDFDEADRRTAVQRWRQWYLAIRPDAEFEG